MAGLLVLGYLALAVISVVIASAESAPVPRPQPGLIVPQRSIDTLAIGMTPAAVKRRFGRPHRIRRSSESESGKPISDWVYSRRHIVATFRRVKGERLTLAGVSTTSRKQRTRNGAGVGSSESDLRSKVRGLDCSDNQNETPRWCSLGIDLPLGRPQTTFTLRKGQVREVDIGLTFP